MSQAIRTGSSLAERKALAQEVILAIAEQSPGNEIEGKGRLYKAFYIAHLFYHVKTGRMLTDWPIVRMPNGPGINGFDELMSGLIAAGKMQIVPTTVGPYPSSKFRAVHCDQPAQLNAMALDAIREAVQYIEGKNFAQLSDITHEFSRSWNAARDGDVLPIYLDLLTDDEYQASVTSATETNDLVNSLWNAIDP